MVAWLEISYIVEIKHAHWVLRKLNGKMPENAQNKEL
jgi:hypothetical protein